MVDSIVSVRMPSSLVQKLKFLSKENHFLDVSEELRSIIRTKSEEYKIPASPHGKIQKTTTQHLKIENKDDIIDATKQEFVSKLKELIKELEHEQ